MLALLTCTVLHPLQSKAAGFSQLSKAFAICKARSGINCSKVREPCSELAAGAGGAASPQCLAEPVPAWCSVFQDQAVSFCAILSAWKLATVVIKPTFIFSNIYLPCILIISCDFADFPALFSLSKNQSRPFPPSIRAVVNVSANQRPSESSSKRAHRRLLPDPSPAPRHAAGRLLTGTSQHRLGKQMQSI